MAVASLQPGHEALGLYDDSPRGLWHVRLLLHHLHEDYWIVVTPDYDIFGKHPSMANGDLAGVRFRTQRSQIPLGVEGGRIYGFATY